MLTAYLLGAVIGLVVGQVQDPSDLSFTGTLLLVALPGVSGLVAGLLYDGLKTILPFYDRLDAKVHQVAAPIVGLLFGYFVVGKLGLQDVDGPAGLDLEWWNASLTSLGMAGIFRFFKRKAAVDGTVAVEATRDSTSLRKGAV